MNNIQNNISEFVQSNNLRRNLFTLILVFIALFLITKTVLTYKQATNYQDVNNINYISVTGKAEEYTKPDTLIFNITVNEEGKDVSEATVKVTTKVDKAIAILTSNGVDKDNIKLESYNVSDKYDTVTDPCVYPATELGVVKTSMMIRPCIQTTSSKIVGQIVTQSIVVKIRDIEKNANNEQRKKIISELTAQNIKADGFTFTVYDIDIIKKEIREEAIKNAKEDAKKLAKDLGVRLDELSSFSDNGNYPVYGMGGDVMNMAKSTRVESAPSAPELTPGQQKITSNVTLTYSIK